MELPGTTIYLYAAYLDTRKVCHLNINYFLFLQLRIELPVIRIIAFVRGETIQERNISIVRISSTFYLQDLSLYCKVWFEDNSDPVIINATGHSQGLSMEIYYFLDYQTLFYGQSPYYFINIELEESLNGKIPAVVSLVETPCFAVPTNSIRGD